MKKRELHKVKMEMRDAWEECFKVKIEQKLNPKGIAKFWDEETDEQEAYNLLTAAAIDLVIEAQLDDILDGAKNVEDVAKAIKEALGTNANVRVIVVEDNEEEEEKKPCTCETCGCEKEKPYRVQRGCFMVEKSFATEQEAKEFIERDSKIECGKTAEDYKILKLV